MKYTRIIKCQNLRGISGKNKSVNEYIVRTFDQVDFVKHSHACCGDRGSVLLQKLMTHLRNFELILLWELKSNPFLAVGVKMTWEITIRESPNKPL